MLHLTLHNTYKYINDRKKSELFFETTPLKCLLSLDSRLLFVNSNYLSNTSNKRDSKYKKTNKFQFQNYL